jgi:probable selenium-dependent hydroxylase accessory protein YqeC
LVDQFNSAVNIAKGDVVTVVGSGGKTSTIRHLVSELKKGLLITTTTHFLSFNEFDHSEIICDSFKDIYNKISDIWFHRPHENIVIGRGVIGSLKDGRSKINGIPPEWIDRLANLYPGRTILVEGDGSASRPIKAPAEYEPVVPDSSTVVLPVQGMKVLGKKINDKNCHRLEMISRLSKTNCISSDLIVKILTDKSSYGYYQQEVKTYIPVLNQIDSIDFFKVDILAQKIIALGIEKVVLADTLRKNPVITVKHRIKS